MSKPTQPVDDTTAALDLPQRIERHHRALRVSELAGLIGMSSNRMYEIAAQGSIPHYRIAGSIRFDPHVTAEWLRQKAA